MRTILFALVAVVAGGVFNVGAARAENYPFCRVDGPGPGDCKFATYEQCLLAISGVGGTCQPNFWNAPAPTLYDEHWLRSGPLYGPRH